MVCVRQQVQVQTRKDICFSELIKLYRPLSDLDLVHLNL